MFLSLPRFAHLVSGLMLLTSLTKATAALPPTLLKEIGIAIKHNASNPEQFTA